MTSGPCFSCNKAKAAHERDKYGNIVLKPLYRSINTPPICVPSAALSKKLDAPFTKAGAFTRPKRVA